MGLYVVNCLNRERVSLSGVFAFVLLEIKSFHQTNPGRVVLAAHNRRVTPRRERLHERRFQIVCWRNSRRLNFCLLRLAGLIVDLPVVVGRNRSSISVVQFRGSNPLGSSLRWPSAAKRRLSRRSPAAAGRTGMNVQRFCQPASTRQANFFV